jgi:hypothetical protein
MARRAKFIAIELYHSQQRNSSLFFAPFQNRDITVSYRRPENSYFTFS